MATLLRPARKKLSTVAVVSLVIMGVVVVFAIAQVVSRRLFEGDRAAVRIFPQQNAVALNVAPDPRRFRVTGLQGPAECLQESRLYALQAGDLLSARDVIRTPAGSRVILRRGETEIEVRENLEVQIGQLVDQTARLDVLRGDGDLTATVGADNEGIAIEANKTETRSQGQARFVVALTSTGKVGVQVSRGAVKFKAKNREVQLGAGQESAAEDSQAPLDPRPIPEDLLLSVTWPELAPGKPATAVQGQTSPAARVMVNGVSAPVRADGTFELMLPPGGAAGPIEVTARDPLGRSRQLSGRGTGKANAPKLESTGEELWRK